MPNLGGVAAMIAARAGEHFKELRHGVAIVILKKDVEVKLREAYELGVVDGQTQRDG